MHGSVTADKEARQRCLFASWATGSHTEKFWAAQLSGPVLRTWMAEINSEGHTKAAAPSNTELAEGLFRTAGYKATICIQQQLLLFPKARCTVKPTEGVGRRVCNVTGAKQHASPRSRFVLCCCYLSSTCWESNFCLKLLTDTQHYCERTNSSKS